VQVQVQVLVLVLLVLGVHQLLVLLWQVKATLHVSNPASMMETKNLSLEATTRLLM
jgi:hypothetical protein